MGVRNFKETILQLNDLVKKFGKNSNSVHRKINNNKQHCKTTESIASLRI